MVELMPSIIPWNLPKVVKETMVVEDPCSFEPFRLEESWSDFASMCEV